MNKNNQEPTAMSEQHRLYAPKIPQPPLTGRWHHGNGILVSGSIRIATWDCDSCPPKEFRDEMLDWICATLNDALAAHKKKESP